MTVAAVWLPTAPACEWCPEPAVKLCDGPPRAVAMPDVTCDARLCERHAARVAPHVDLCPYHLGTPGAA